MRRLVFLAVLFAGPALAETGLNRYGQAGSVDPTQVAGQPMYGPYLNWAGKRLPQPVAAAPSPSAMPMASLPPPVAAPAPGPLANAYMRRRLDPDLPVPAPQAAPQPTQLAARYQAPAASGFVPQVPRGYAPLPPPAAEPRMAARPLPDSLYGPAAGAQTAPTSSPVAEAPPAPVAVAPRPAAGASIAERLAAAPPPVTNGPGPRLYSVHRGYGLQPDAIPQAQSGTGYVLIGPDNGGVQIPDLPQKPEPDPDKPF